MIDLERFQEALILFNNRDFFECHEVLEDLWRPLPPGAEKTFLQGLLQVSVGFHHWQNGNRTGTRNLLLAGCEKLDSITKTPEYIPPIQLSALLEAVKPLLARAQSSRTFTLPEFPKVTPV